MLASVATLSRSPSRQQIAEALQLPDVPADLSAAERAHAEVAADLAATRTNFDRLNLGFDDYSIVKVDGTPFPIEGRTHQLGHLFNRRTQLEKAEQDAQRKLSDARRAFADAASEKLRPEADAICEAVMEHLGQAEELLSRFDEVATEALKAGCRIRHDQLGPARTYIARLSDIRRALVPTPRMARK